jgi:hypothetical protein
LVVEIIEKISDAIQELASMAQFKSVEPTVSLEQPHLHHQVTVKPISRMEAQNHVINFDHSRISVGVWYPGALWIRPWPNLLPLCVMSLESLDVAQRVSNVSLLHFMLLRPFDTSKSIFLAIMLVGLYVIF